MWQTHSTLVGSIQTARPISVSKDMTAVSLRPDRTQKDLSGHMIAVGLLLNHFTALRYSLLSANRGTSWNSHNTFSEIPGSPATPSPLLRPVSVQMHRSRRTGTITLPVPRVLIYYRYIITRVLLHTHKDMIVKHLRTELTARFSFMCLKPDL